MTNFQYRFLLLALLVLSITTSKAHAQRTLGVQWAVPENPQTAEAQLEQFNDLGISILNIDSNLSPRLWQTVDSLEFRVWGELGVRFPTTNTFANPDTTLIVQIQNRASSYLSQSSVSAIGLFSFGATNQPTFWEQLAPIASQLRTNNKIRLYHTGRSAALADTLVSDFLIFDTHITVANVDTFSIPLSTNIGAYRYSPSPALASYLYPFSKFIDQTASVSTTPIFLESHWLLQILDKHPGMEEQLQNIASQPTTALALPEEDLPVPQPSTLPVIILLAVWGSVAFHYHSNPIYRKSIFRYFSAHKFFITDIFQRHIRSPFPAILIILQNALLTATSIFAGIATGMSTIGMEALFYHFPILATWDNSLYSFFIWAVLLILFLFRY
ncbi:MAG: hypothetical protein U5J63_11805 [Fodinibius sp.]|nr:hypothetical protein [Fodinibius sp.]